MTFLKHHWDPRFLDSHITCWTELTTEELCVASPHLSTAGRHVLASSFLRLSFHPCQFFRIIGMKLHSKRKLQLPHFLFPFILLPSFLSTLCSDKPRLLGNASEKLTQPTMISWIQPSRITILENVFRPNLFSHSHSQQNCRKNHSCLKAKYSEVQYYTTAFVRGKINKPQTSCCQKWWVRGLF